MNELVVAIAIILFPGLIATVICDSITVHRPRWGVFKYGVFSFIFGVGCYIFIEGLNSVFPIIDCIKLFGQANLTVWSVAFADKTYSRWAEVFAATLVSPIVAFVAAYLYDSKVINWLAGKLYVSNKYGDENLFSFYLNANDTDWVYLRNVRSNLTYHGRVMSFSEADNLQEIVLAGVKVYESSNSEFLYEVLTLYIAGEPGDFVIESIPVNQMGVSHEKDRN